MDTTRKLKLLKAKQAQSVDTEQVDQLAESLSHQLVKEVQESPITLAIEDLNQQQTDNIEQLKAEMVDELTYKVEEIKASIPKPVDKVEITNLSTVLNQLKLVQESIDLLTIPDEVKISNLPEQKAPIVNVTKATDDIYARYDYAASNTEIDGTYIGYEQQSGAWFIQRISNGVQGQLSTYAAGKQGFTAAWENRLKLDYHSRSEVIIP